MLLFAGDDFFALSDEKEVWVLLQWGIDRLSSRLCDARHTGINVGNFIPGGVIHDS